LRPHPCVYATVHAEIHADLLAALHGRWRVTTRILMILLSAQGWSALGIAELLGYDPVTVRRWIRRFDRDGIAGLADRPRSGRPQLGSPRLGKRIRRLLARPRAWTIPLVHRYVGRPAMSLRTLRRRVREVAAWRRPRLVAKGAPDAEQVVAGVRAAIAELPDGAVVLAEDEIHIDLLPWVRSTWIPTCTRQPVMTPGSNRRRSIFGAVDLASGRWFYQVARRAISATFITFCEHVLAGYPDAPVVAMVCDNVILHRSKKVQAWLATQPRLRLLYGARYSPHHNPVERIRGALKAYLANSPILTMAGRIRQVHAFFRHRTCDQLLHTAAPHSSPWLPDSYRSHLRQAA
jgi:transposase